MVCQTIQEKSNAQMKKALGKLETQLFVYARASTTKRCPGNGTAIGPLATDCSTA
jgi:hypothetical protein